MIKVFLIDDDEVSRLNLRLVCGQLPDIDIVGEFDSAIQAYEALGNNTVDLLLLDIEMPQLSGMDLVRSVQHLPSIIFITSNESYAATAFDYLDNVVDYIVKPVRLQRLQIALQRYHSRHPHSRSPSGQTHTLSGQAQTPPPHIFVKTDKKHVRIPLQDLLYVEVKGDYAIFKTTTGQQIVNASLKYVEEQLPPDNFVKVHRSFIVNIHRIDDIEQHSLVIGPKVIPISRAHRATLMERLPLL